MPAKPTPANVESKSLVAEKSRFRRMFLTAGLTAGEAEKAAAVLARAKCKNEGIVIKCKRTGTVTLPSGKEVQV